MRTFIVVLFTSFFLVNTSALAQCDTCICPKPFQNAQGLRIPPFAHKEPMLSPDRSLLYYDPGYILNLASLVAIPIAPSGGLPGEQILAISGVVWCPYDRDIILVNTSMFVDTGESGGSQVYLRNVFRYRISTGESLRITPDTAGKFGAYQVAFSEWYSGSSPGNDTFRISFRSTSREDDSGFYGLYIPHTDTFIPQPEWWWGSTIVGASSDSQAIIRGTRNTQTQELGMPYLLNADTIGLPFDVSYARAYFSLSDSIFALQVRQVGLGQSDEFRFPQLWIYRTDDVSAPIHRIDFQRSFCTYSFHGINPVFLTDSTIAVSMHADGDTASLLWEITINGQIVRQLTSLPAASVKKVNSRLALSSQARIIRDGVTIEVQPLAQVSQLSIVNMMGQIVLTHPIGPGEQKISIDLAELPTGMYYCFSGESPVIPQWIIIQR